jgi:flagellar motility protein MotE (MotC chaperone)
MSAVAWWLAWLAMLGGMPMAWAAQEAKNDQGQNGGKLNVTEANVTPTEVVPDERVFSVTEVQMLTELDTRRVALDRREQALALREKLVDLLEQRLTMRVGELQALKGELEGLLKSLSGKDDNELVQLSGMYGAMKPAVAAGVLNRLDNAIVLDVLTRMPAKKSAKIMESLEPVKARVLSEMLAEKTPVPVVGVSVTEPATVPARGADL